jgi:DNA-binding transcriptional regulator YiaG
MEQVMSLPYNGDMTLPKIDLPNGYLADLCRRVREEAGLTQEEMARVLGTTQRSYQRWESGHREPNGEFTAKLFILQEQLEAKRAKKKKD